MVKIEIKNPFKAPVFHKEVISSTMDVARQLAVEGVRHGTVVVADFQETGRGRVSGRKWEMEKGVSLPFTILLKFPSLKEIPVALTLRTGLAVSLAIEDFAPCLKNKVFIKWPNDIMINNKKVAGILCETDGGDVFLGIGINVAQKEFPLHLQNRATSISNEQRIKGLIANSNERFVLLEKILMRLFDELEIVADANWKHQLELRLYKGGEEVVFIDGAVDSWKEVRGCLAGVGDSGELLILPDGESRVMGFIVGEIRLL